MNCPSCNRPDSRVLKSFDNGASVHRRRLCSCGVVFTSTELTDDAITAISGQGWPLVARIQPPLATNGHGGVGGGLSSDRSGTGPKTGSSLSNPGDLQLHGPITTRRAKPLSPPAYPPEFELAWAACDKVGTKADALRAWDQVGRPAADVLATSWAAWKRIAWVDGIGLQHVATWLRAFNWREAPVPRPRTGAPPAPPSDAGMAVYCAWHREPLNHRKPALRPLATCPNCKHFAATSQKRTGEPQSLADLAGGK